MSKRGGDRGLVISVSGLHGVGKSVYAKEIAKRYNLRYISSGKLFREYAKIHGYTLEELSSLANKNKNLDEYIDNTVIKEAEKGNIVADGLLTGWMLKDIADIKFWFKAEDNVRFQRIANRDRISLELAIEETISRERSEIGRFKRYYGINIYDLSIYDYVIDTSYLLIDDVLNIIFKIIDRFLTWGLKC